MPWYHYISYFFGGAFLTNAIPHFVAGLMGHAMRRFGRLRVRILFCSGGLKARPRTEESVLRYGCPSHSLAPLIFPTVIDRRHKIRNLT
jgi:hypothetical protein